MEKDLLDISGKDDEDYWLLKTTPKKGVSSFAGGNSGRKKSSLNCSALQIPRSSHIIPNRPPFSSTGRVTGNIMEQPCPSVGTGNVGKENTSDNKVELPKLSVERQQMKKKKKNAVFNLRKSLAWDRAFSTEEGVLDSSELSKITGGDLLSAIQEEFRESTSVSKCTSVSPGLQALEENLFNDLPVNSIKRGKKILNGKLPKYASPSKVQSSLAQKKVTTAQDMRSGSKRSGCHRPPTSSLKRPANAHTTTPRSRELSLSEVSITKSDTLTVVNNMKRITQSSSKVKKNQPTQIKNSQRSLGSVSNSQSSGSVSNSQSLRSVSFSHNTSSTKSKTKSNLGSKSSITKSTLNQARRNVISKTLEIASVSNSQYSVAGKSNIGSMTTSDVAMIGHASNNPDFKVITIGASLAQSSCNRVGSTQPAVSRLGKPSGLRVPSPSIGYFSQSNSQPSQSAGDKHNQLPRSDVCSASSFSLIPTFEKPLPQVAQKVPGVYAKGAIGNIGSSGSTAGFSAQSINFKPSQVKVKVDLKSTREVESKVSCCSLSSQVKENLQHPCIIRGDTGKIVLDDINICTSEKISTAKCEDLQSTSELPPSECKNSVQEGNIFSDNRDEKRKSFCSVEENYALPLKDSMDSPMHGPGVELALFNNYSQLKVSNPREEVTCTSIDFSGDFDTLDKHGQPLNECVHAENGDEISPCLLGEKKALLVYHSKENVAKQPDVLDALTADPTFLGDLSSMKSDIEDSFSEKQLGSIEYVFVHSEIVEAPDSVESPCNHLEGYIASNSIICDHNMECDGPVVFEREKSIEIIDNNETNCEADFVGPFTDCKDWFRKSEEGQLSSQLVFDVKAGCNEIDVLTRNLRADNDDGRDVQIDYFTGSSDAEQNMEQVKVLTPSFVEARMEIKPLGSSHEPFSEKLTSEKQTQYNGSSIANISEGNDGCVKKQTDQFVTSDECSPAKDASAAVLCYLNEELEDNSELEDMDLVTESNCSDEEPEGNMELIEEGVFTESDLNRDLDDFFVKEILNQECTERESIHTVLNRCGETKTRLSKSISSSTSVLEDHECLNEDSSLSRISEGMSKEDTNAGYIAHNYVGKAKIQTDTEKDCSTQITEQELGSHEEEEVQVIKISTDLVAGATREKESRTPIPLNRAFSDRDDMQPNKFAVLSDDILKLDRNRAHALESSSKCTCASEGEDKMIKLDAKLEKKTNPILVKPPNAVPFSDEWLAAIEAAGEEILTLKSGQVQHSPTEKSAPEPGPWSPVKKKSNQVVGPFDCTKYNNKGLPPAFN